MENSLKSNNQQRSLFRRLYAPFYNRQTYRNWAYLLLSFPLGLAYLVFLTSGISAGMGLTFVLIGFPILFGVLAGGVVLSQIERFFAKRLLGVDISAESPPLLSQHTLRDRILGTITDLQTWKSLIYLFLKFPLGVMTFAGMTTAISTAFGFLFAPLFYLVSGGEFFATFGGSLVGTLMGIVMVPLVLHLGNGWAWLNGKFANVMLGNRPAASRNPRSGKIARKMEVIESGEDYLDPLAEIDALKEAEKVRW